MSYRVETASSGRAGCQSTACKKANLKIPIHDLRFGVWVDQGDRASWRWRHWGCVSGHTIQNLRESLEDPDHPGTYRWDMLDGYEGDDDKNSLSAHPDLQQKVREVIEQGFIHPEDFNGDPEMNKLGEKGLYNKVNAKKARDLGKFTKKLEILEKAAGGDARPELVDEINALKELIENLAGGTSAKEPKRARAEGAEEEEAKAPPKKKRATKAKAKKEETDDEDEAPAAKLAKKPRAKKVKKEETYDEDEAPAAKPAKQPRAKKVVKKEETDDEDKAPAGKPAKKPRAQKVVKKEESDVEMPEVPDEEKEPATTKKARAKKAVKNEEVVKSEAKSEDDFDAPAVVTAPKKRASRAKKVKEELVVDEEGAAVATDKVRKKAFKNEPVDDKAAVEATFEQAPAKKGRKKATKREPVRKAETEMSDNANAMDQDDSTEEKLVVEEPISSDNNLRAPKPGRRAKSDTSATKAKASRRRAASGM